MGFLRYFQVKQIPNFLLASPLLVLAAAALYTYGSFQPRLFFSLGFNIPLSQWRKLALLPENSVVKKQVNKDNLDDSSALPGLSALAPEVVQGIFISLLLRKSIKECQGAPSTPWCSMCAGGFSLIPLSCGTILTIVMYCNLEWLTVYDIGCVTSLRNKFNTCILVSQNYDIAVESRPILM